MQRRPEQEQRVASLVCLECGDESDEAVGWRAYIDENELLDLLLGLRRPRIRLLAAGAAPSLG